MQASFIPDSSKTQSCEAKCDEPCHTDRSNMQAGGNYIMYTWCLTTLADRDGSAMCLSVDRSKFSTVACKLRCSPIKEQICQLRGL